MKLSDLKWILLRNRRALRKRLFKRHRLNHRVIALDITYHCNLKCFNCNRSCRQAPSQDTMTLDQVERFIQDSIRQQRRWREIKIEGGEPTLHPQFFEILRLVRDYRCVEARRTRISVSTNGYGPEVRAVLAHVPEDVFVYNSGKDGPVRDEFDAVNVAPIDLEGHRDSDFTRACDVAFYFGIGLNPYGYYPCTVSGGIDRVFGLDLGKKQLPRQGDPMRDLLSRFCRLCGHFIPFHRIERSEDISATWAAAYSRHDEAPPRLTLY